MKRTISLALAFVLVLLFASCGDSNAKNTKGVSKEVLAAASVLKKYDSEKFSKAAKSEVVDAITSAIEPTGKTSELLTALFKNAEIEVDKVYSYTDSYIAKLNITTKDLSGVLSDFSKQLASDNIKATVNLSDTENSKKIINELIKEINAAEGEEITTSVKILLEINKDGTHIVNFDTEVCNAMAGGGIDQLLSAMSLFKLK